MLTYLQSFTHVFVCQELTQLDASLARARTAGVQSGEGRKLLRTATLLRKMRAALLEGPAWQEVRAAIERLEEPETFDVAIGQDTLCEETKAGLQNNEMAKTLSGCHVLVANEVSAVKHECYLHFRTRDALLAVIAAAEQRDLSALREALARLLPLAWRVPPI